MNQEVKIINGYSIKDEVARNSITDMKSDKAEFIFPKFWENADFGDCNLIKYKDKSILIDCYNTQVWDNVKQMLQDNNVEHIDYLIITHYHGDHFGNFYNLANNNFIDNETMLFMPAETTTMEWNSIITDVKNFCLQNNLNYNVPEENEVVEIGNSLKITFTNCNPEILDELYNSDNIGRNQNNTSTVVLFEHNKVKASFLGDCEKEAYDRLENIKFFKGNVKLHKIGHHGIESNGNFNVLSTLNPKYAVATGNIGGFQDCEYINSYESNVLSSLGTLIYPVYLNNQYIKFISNGIEMYCENGIPYKVGENTTSRGFTYYVDNSVDKDSFQNGTIDYPFKELMQAITSIPEFLNTDININLANGTYGIPKEDEQPTDLFSNGIKIINNIKRNIIINGNSNDKTLVKLNSTRIANSNVIFNNLSFMCDNYVGLRIYNSNVTLKKCLISSEEQSTYNGIESTASSLYIQNSKIENCKDGIYPKTTNIVTYRLEFGTVSNKYLISEKIDDNNILDLETRFSTNTDILDSIYHYSKNISPVLLYSNSTPDYTKTRVDLNTNFNKFQLLMINVEYANSGKDTIFLYDFIGKHKKITDIRGGQNNCTFRSTDLYVGTNYVELSSFINFLISYSDSSITNNYGTNYTSINSIIGFKFEDITDISSVNENTQV